MSTQNLSPMIKAIKARYGEDKERIQAETSRVYKEAGVNPLAGCFPTLVQLPVFWGLYRALQVCATRLYIPLGDA
jgi:YidC/Oxa1 family membrane protein insertase